MKQNKRLTGRRIGAATVLAAVTTYAGLALAPAAFADSTVASATAHGATRSAVAHPATAVQCYNTLQLHSYPVTTARSTACYEAALNQPNTLVICASDLQATGVDPYVAEQACVAGASAGVNIQPYPAGNIQPYPAGLCEAG